MPEIGVRELKARASEIVRDVRERRARYTVTHRGRPVGVLLPIDEAPLARDDDATWERLKALGDEIAKDWPTGLSAGDLLSDMRR